MSARDKSYCIEPQTAEFKTTGQGIAAVADSASKVDINDFNGGRSSTWRDDAGLIHVLMRDSLTRGKANEPSVRDVLGQLIEGTIEGGIDGEGEDGILSTPHGERFVIQIVTVPADVDINREIRQGKIVKRVLTLAEAAGWIQTPIALKLARTPAKQRPSVILVLDARHLGILSDGDILAEYRRIYPDARAHGFNQIWLIGPTAARSALLA